MQALKVLAVLVAGGIGGALLTKILRKDAPEGLWIRVWSNDIHGSRVAGQVICKRSNGSWVNPDKGFTVDRIRIPRR